MPSPELLHSRIKQFADPTETNAFIKAFRDQFDEVFDAVFPRQVFKAPEAPEPFEVQERECWLTLEYHPESHIERIDSAGLLQLPRWPEVQFDVEWHRPNLIWVERPIASLREWFYLKPRCGRTLWLVDSTSPPAPFRRISHEESLYVQ